MAQRKSGSTRSGSSGGDGCRGVPTAFGPPPSLASDVGRGSGRHRGRGGGGGASRRPNAPADRIGTMGRVSGGSKLRALWPAPLPCSLSRCRRGPTSHNRLGAPDQGASRSRARSLDRTRRSTPTHPPARGRSFTVLWHGLLPSLRGGGVGPQACIARVALPHPSTKRHGDASTSRHGRPPSTMAPGALSMLWREPCERTGVSGRREGPLRVRATGMAVFLPKGGLGFLLLA